MSGNHPLRLPIGGLLAVLLLSTLVSRAAEVTPEKIAEQKKAFAEERQLAIEQKFTDEGLRRADELAKKAEKYLEKKNLAEAYKHFRDARWQIPYLPPGLPKHIVRVFGQSRMRHGDVVNGVALNKAGTQVVSVSRDGVLKVWDLANGREVRAYRGHKSNIRAVAWSPDDQWIASGSTQIHLWNPKTDEVKILFKGNEKEKERDKEINTLAFHPEGKQLVSGGEDRTVRVWDLEKGEESLRFDQQNMWISQVAYSPNGKLIVSASNDGTVAIWNTNPAKETKRLVHKSSEHTNGTYAVAYDFDGKAIFTAGGDSTAHKIGAPGPNGEYIEKVTGIRQKDFNLSGGGHDRPITALAVSPDGKMLVTGSEDNSIRIWEVSTGKVVRVMQGHNDHITSLAISSDAGTLISASKDHTIRVWTLDLNDTHRTLNGHKGYVWSAMYSPDGSLVASAGADQVIRIWNNETGTEIASLPGHDVAVTAICFNHDGTKLVSCGGDNLVKLWDVKENKLLKEYKGHTAPVMAVAISKDGKQLLSGSADRTAKLWNVDSAEVAHTFDVRAPVSAVLFRDDGKEALIGSADGMMRVIEFGPPMKENPPFVAHQSGVAAIAYSPDSKRIVTCGGDRLVNVWSVSANGNPALISELKGHNQPVSSVAYSPDGRFIASGGGDLVVRIWNAATLLEIRALRGHTDWVSSVAFAPDGKSIISAGVDRTVRLWELAREETIAVSGHSLPIRAVAIDPTGKWLASGSDDRTIKLWNLETGFVEATLSGHTDEVTAVVFDPKEPRLLSGSKDMKILTWDLKTRKVTSTLNTDTVANLVYTPSGEKLLTWLRRPGMELKWSNVAQVNDREGKAVAQFSERTRNVSCLSFSIDGELTAVGFPDGVVRIWNLTKNEKVGADFPVTQKTVADVAFTVDKNRLITADEDSEVKVWDLNKREEIKTFQAHKVPFYLLAMSPNGKQFATVAENEVKLWDTEEFKELRSWELPSGVKNLIFSPDGKSLVSANGDTTLYLLELP